MAAQGADEVRRSGAIRHEGFMRHGRFRWAKIAAVVAVVAILIYALDDPQPRPSGGSAYGYVLGTIGAGLILWLTALGLRKRTMSRGVWSLKAWTSAHVYLGLALLVIGTLHTGFQFGWNVHTLAYALMVLVILSGMVGVGLYVALPRMLSTNRGELTESQMVAALRSLDRQLLDAAQPLDQARADIVGEALAEDPLAVGTFARLTGRRRHDPTRDALEAVRGGRPARPASPGDPMVMLEGLLERRQSMLARLRRHLQLRGMLEIWLYVHVPATIALIAALIAHITAVFFYW
jgi:hypothetical protein